MTSDKAWALGVDYGIEGQRPPLTLFHSQEEAEAAKLLIEEHHGNSCYVVEVPFWPKTRLETAP